MPNITAFNPEKHHIHLAAFITTKEGEPFKLRAILDTGAPATELSDQFLLHAGILESHQGDVTVKPGLETQKYGKITLPSFKICSHEIPNMTVYISHFEKSWGIDALIGLDFLRRFRTTIDYQKGQIETEPFSA